MPALIESAKRTDPGTRLAHESPLIARACRDMALRFADGATLIVFGSGGAAADAHHIAVEFVHPVIVGKRALPTVALVGDAPAGEMRQLARPGDIALGVSHTSVTPEIRTGLDAAKQMGLLTIALTGGDLPGCDVDHMLCARSDDPLIARELQVTTYHLLWELVHVFLDATCNADEHCITCSDEAVEVRVLELRPDNMALVDTGSTVEEVSVALVDVNVGGRILVHAGEAIAALEAER